MTKTKRAALYVRVSTDRQTVENQIAALTKVAEARGWQVVETFSDVGIRSSRPGRSSLVLAPLAQTGPAPRVRRSHGLGDRSHRPLAG
jgi:predicted site-specific integrase-resolvase